ncbi:unnamed protein product [Rotaria sordida]|uniref:E3 ubiquitin-protein ligase NRDP1 n=1 Tax=Rotaria sordida TaxID=392033 RepID=A0A814C7M2_9BILA|nr:unnamed protein product [Rotaria sordida]CAF1043318.1 unnamed protein product [Rotaria sordida]CAF1198555.1 unnamed protein product [Rotaria sordida]CAF1219911.1 unnamed protein product [Rotaria sordida]CAF3813485.1 unnamed protein product [Rotaria sordida]
MGFDTQRFLNAIDEELICSICGGVLQDPLQIPSCEHVFCRTCIEEWLSQTQTCPIDRTPIEINQLKLVPRIIKNLLNHLEIKCENEGCTTTVKLDVLANHLVDCEYNKEQSIQCENGCGMIISNGNHRNHNCVQALNSELNSVKHELEKYRHDVEFYKTEISTLQEFIRVSRANSTVSDSFEDGEHDATLRWSTNLQLARITYWGGMISTPNIILQNTIKDALLESGCPINIIDDLMKNAHEQYWPQGLSTLETRQLNRQHYESYVCRRISNEQAIVVLSCDNRHMNQSMISEPGIVIIFSHGVK